MTELNVEPEAAAPGAHPGEPRQSHRCLRVGVGENQSWVIRVPRTPTRAAHTLQGPQARPPHAGGSGSSVAPPGCPDPSPAGRAAFSPAAAAAAALRPLARALPALRSDSPARLPLSASGSSSARRGRPRAWRRPSGERRLRSLARTPSAPRTPDGARTEERPIEEETKGRRRGRRPTDNTPPPEAPRGSRETPPTPRSRTPPVHARQLFLSSRLDELKFQNSAMACGDKWGADGWESSISYRAVPARRSHQQAPPICCVTLGDSRSISGPRLLHP
nr:uncharacterized protein LOC110124133 [Odocoileus virginianus texanus]